ncbi:hypothetical protein QQS21_010391 [Conoideocrella luteorostrata]|uniref:Heterokaryon incompatibility domain-containing protein n=1 Tax=Conoideocrella luteorostrata TaxID=1105319 RepID=A0AAJ0CG21_9HYPO|nr:hypothetical protein QQS21_010391 [Conoideocrella luteorostrata]
MAVDFDLDSNWKHYTTSVYDEISRCEKCPDRPYLSLAVPWPDDPKADTIFTVRRIVFTTVSHDQGYCDDKSVHGKYGRASHTGFEARVVDSAGRERVSRRYIQENIIACFDFKKHVNCWDYRNTARSDMDENRDADLSLADWLQKIQSGDRIQIVPKAIYQGWVNFIKEAHVDIWVEEVVTNTSDGCNFVSSGNNYSAYRRLDDSKKEIRLVVIEPATTIDDPIQLSIRYTPLAESDHVPYDALSYCWGEDRASKAVTLIASNESQLTSRFEVSSNLFVALTYLRQNDRPRTFWIDQICINQSKIKERESQVALMAEIFASAKSVWVWLGGADPDVEKDFSIIRTIAQNCTKGHAKNVQEATQLGGRREDHSIIIGGNWYQSENDRMFCRPWFQRVWVLQEVWNRYTSLSTRENVTESQVVVFCGSHELSWDLVVQTNYCFNNYYPFLSHNVMPAVWSKLFDIRRTSAPLELQIAPAPRQDILTVIISGLDMQATDRRDKIYALLGFGKET